MARTRDRFHGPGGPYLLHHAVRRYRRRRGPRLRASMGLWPQFDHKTKRPNRPWGAAEGPAATGIRARSIRRFMGDRFVDTNRFAASRGSGVTPERPS